MAEIYKAASEDLDAGTSVCEDATGEQDNDDDFGPFPEIADDPPPGPGT